MVEQLGILEKRPLHLLDKLRFISNERGICLIINEVKKYYYITNNFDCFNWRNNYVGKL
jgi:hypothetical protein